jgi:hypothetical protein
MGGYFYKKAIYRNFNREFKILPTRERTKNFCLGGDEQSRTFNIEKR